MAGGSLMLSHKDSLLGKPIASSFVMLLISYINNHSAISKPVEQEENWALLNGRARHLQDTLSYRYMVNLVVIPVSLLLLLVVLLLLLPLLTLLLPSSPLPC